MVAYCWLTRANRQPHSDRLFILAESITEHHRYTDCRPNSVATMMGCRDLQCSAIRKDTKSSLGIEPHVTTTDDWKEKRNYLTSCYSTVLTGLYRVPWVIWSVSHEPWGWEKRQQGTRTDSRVLFSCLHRTTARVHRYNRQCLRFGCTWSGKDGYRLPTVPSHPWQTT